MHIPKASKAVFILANYVTANIIPPHLKNTIRLNAGSSPNDKETDKSVSTIPTNPPISPDLILVRQDGNTCERCRSSCPSGRIIHPNDCGRCIRCPPKMKADPTFRVCIDGEPEPDKDPRKEEKEERYQEKKKVEQKNHKQRKYEPKKERERMKYQANEERKQDNERRKKVRRAARCLPLVAMGMGATIAAEFADEFFDEAYLESMDLEQFWPEDVPVEPWDTEDSDKLFEEDEYIDKWIEYGNSGGEGGAVVEGITLGRRGTHHPEGTRSLVEREDVNLTALIGSGQEAHMLVFGPDGLITEKLKMKTRQPTDLSTADMAHPHALDERFLQFLIPIFMAVVGTVGKVASSAARAGGKVLELTRYTVKIGTGKSSKKSFKEQSDGARKISQSKNWRNCLTRGIPGV